MRRKLLGLSTAHSSYDSYLHAVGDSETVAVGTTDNDIIDGHRLSGAVEILMTEQLREGRDTGRHLYGLLVDLYFHKCHVYYERITRRGRPPAVEVVNCQVLASVLPASSSKGKSQPVGAPLLSGLLSLQK